MCTTSSWIASPFIVVAKYDTCPYGELTSLATLTKPVCETSGEFATASV